MKYRWVHLLAMTLSVSGVLFMIAGQGRFGLLPHHIARFVGIACFMLAGLVWSCGFVIVRPNK